jgi:hypothetical protein
MGVRRSLGRLLPFKHWSPAAATDCSLYDLNIHGAVRNAYNILVGKPKEKRNWNTEA